MTNKGYWKRRALILEQLVRDKADATVAEIARLYDLAQESIVQQIEKIFDTYAKGGALNEAQARELLSVKQTAEYREELQALYAAATDADVKQDLLARLNAPAYAWRIGRLEALRDRVYAEARMAGLTEVSYVRDRLEDALGFGYYRETYELQRGAGTAYDFTRLSNNQVKAALTQEWNGGNWSSRLWANNRAFATAVEEAVVVGILAGLRYDEMRDNLLRAIGMDATQGAKYRAARLVRTECAYIAGQGQLLGYREAGLESYVFLATLDLRTSEICRSLDMKRFPLRDAQAGENFPPMHPNCRSTTMGALTDEEIARLRRSARDPVTGKVTTVPGNMSYREWYAEYVEDSDEARANEQMIRNRASDRAQYAEYQQILGDKAPKSLEEFQRLKYTDSEGRAALRQARADAKLQADIRNGKYDLTVNQEKQARHMQGSEGYIPGRSYITVSVEELQEIVNQYAGHGVISRGGRSGIREIIDVGRVVGVVVNKTGATAETSRLKIHYSKTGVHVVPIAEKKAE